LFSKRNLIAFGLIIIIWAIGLLSMLVPQARLWGINHLEFLPALYTNIYLMGGILVLLLLIPVFRAAAGKIYGLAADAIFDDRHDVRWVLLSIIALVLFWIFRIPIHLLGDSYSVMENIGNDLPVILKWSEMGAVASAMGLAQLLPFSGTELGRYAYEIISVLSGAITIYFMCGLAFELAKEAVGRLLILMLLIAAGWIVLFLGYTENYPILWPFISGYVYFGVRHIKGEGRLLWPTIFLVGALACHMQTIFFALSYPVLFMADDQSRKTFRKHRNTILTGGAIVVVAVVVVFIWIMRNSPEIGYLIMPIFRGHPASPDYWLLSPAHIIDIINQYLLLVPLLPSLMVIGWRRWRAIKANQIDLFLMVLTLGGLAFILFIDPKLGMARDWDLFALVGLPPALFFGRSVANSGPKYLSLFPILSLAAIVLITPFIITVSNTQPAIDNYKYLLNLDLPKSRVGITRLEKMYRDKQDIKTADSLHTVLVQTYPAITLMPQAMALYRQGLYTEAMTIVNRLAQYDPNSVEVLDIRGLLNMKLGNYNLAIKELERVSKAEGYQYNSGFIGNLAVAYQNTGNYDKALKTWRRGQKYNPDSEQIMNGLMSIFFTMGQYDSAIVYGTRLIELNPDKTKAYDVVGQSAYRLKYYTAAKKYLSLFLEKAPDDPDRSTAESILKRLQ